ncbi:DNA polymerase family A-domain-containing protein [Gautieria morchelliformis]|nr:DNA polymerase family A-domain-containing protein [Gautieria morchelliformis]
MHSRIYAANRAYSLHGFHSLSRAHSQALKQKASPSPNVQGKTPQQIIDAPQSKQANDATFAKRNQVGVQLLSRSLHAQIFKNVAFPAPPATYTQIAREHLARHQLDPASSSSHPDIAFTLPPLRGHTIDSHFHAIGAEAAEPYLSMSKQMASTTLPPRPESWVIQSGWTKYWTGEDGLHESVESPDEELLVFDVESMPKYHQFSVLACAASPTAWYAWISPWLLGESTDPQQLIPLGDPSGQRIVIGHNVSYDRARTREEYCLERPGTRWLDTMALHVAVNGISSHQRPAWSKYRKQKQASRTMKDEAVESVLGLIAEFKREAMDEHDVEKRGELLRRVAEMEESLPSLQAISEVGGEREDDGESDEMAQQRWEDLTSANSLADVARLHCDIEMDKSTRDDFMTSTPDAILADISSYLTYCANDVAVTHEVFRKTLPAFLEKCPSPVSFAGMCSMGSSFLTVNESWERYLENAESKYRELEGKVGAALRSLAEDARLLLANDKWKGDVWLEQLDWTPKKPRKTAIRKVEVEPTLEPRTLPSPDVFASQKGRKLRIVPKFYNDMDVLGVLDPYVLQHIIPFILRLELRGEPVRYDPTNGWHTLSDAEEDVAVTERIVLPAKKKTRDLFDRAQSFSLYKKGILGRQNGESMKAWVTLLSRTEDGGLTSRLLLRNARRLISLYSDVESSDRADFWPWMEQLDWTPVQLHSTDLVGDQATKHTAEGAGETAMIPKWYWQLGRPKVETSQGNIDITVRSRVAPILLKLKWQGWPLVHSREHGWTFRVAREALKTGSFATRQKELSFYHDADEALRVISDGDGEFAFFKLPHKDGEAANVGSPLGKTFLKFAADGTLSSPGQTAKEALDINAQCSYWISARDRIMKQMVVWDDAGRQGLRSLAPAESKWGMILPQVITMGTVTRRAIEKTWLTASNAKVNRIGSELKAMVRAPEGYAIVGADVDSEELWISSCMGDAQFGLHGATAIGWMTLEGTKKAGTDLHSKTAGILGISRNQAKVFNYSRIYGAGMKHAMLLLLQSNASMLPEEAQRLAEQLYASTKGKNTHRTDMFGCKFWFGGTESFVFNKLEAIALSDQPKTPALGCGVTYALSKQYLPQKFGSDYLPSRINWVVQSSGVDYLHLLIVSMEHLCQTYGIQARYLISVHDELRYLVKEEDKYRAALALQIANLWTRSLFAYRLGMDDLPQGVAFFSAVDVDKVLRKEVDMPCVTPSQPVPIPPGETLDIVNVLEKTNGGSLWKDGSPMQKDSEAVPLSTAAHVSGSYVAPDCLIHRAKSANWLKAQATVLFEEVKFLAGKDARTTFDGGIGWKKSVYKKPGQSGRKVGRPRKLGNIECVETWDGKE